MDTKLQLTLLILYNLIHKTLVCFFSSYPPIRYSIIRSTSKVMVLVPCQKKTQNEAKVQLLESR